MATNVGKSKTKENNKLGPAVVTVNIGDKELRIGTYAVFDNGKVWEDSLNIGQLETHECVYDERKKIAKRILTGKDGNKKEVPVVDSDIISRFKVIAKAKAKETNERD